MKSHKLLLSALTAGTFFLASTLVAQDNTPPPPPPAPAGAPMPPPPPPPPPASNSSMPASAASPQAQPPDIKSGPAPAPTVGPAPSFEQLSGGKKFITMEQADAYPPLANDFDNADRGKNHKISKAEYAHWVKQLGN